MQHRDKNVGPRPADQVGEAKLGQVTFGILRALGSTVRQGEVASSMTIGAAYDGLAKALGLHPDQEPKREAVCRALQQAWYETPPNAGEPPRVKARREALYARMAAAPTDESPAPKPQRAAEMSDAPDKPKGVGAAHFIRQGIREGLTTEQIVATVRLAYPESKADAKAVAYYRHELKKKGENK